MKDLFKQLELLGLNLAKTRGITTTVIDFVCDKIDYDQEIFVRVDMDLGKIIGLNFMYGINDGRSSWDGEICEHLTEIYNRLKHSDFDMDDDVHTSDRVMKAIELYSIAFLEPTIFLDGTYVDGRRVNKED
jgi:hypothetical protein